MVYYEIKKSPHGSRIGQRGLFMGKHALQPKGLKDSIEYLKFRFNRDNMEFSIKDNIVTLTVRPLQNVSGKYISFYAGEIVDFHYSDNLAKWERC